MQLNSEVLRQYSFDTQTFEDIRRAGRRSRSNSVTSIGSTKSRKYSRNNSLVNDAKEVEAEIAQEDLKFRRQNQRGRRGSFVEALNKQDNVSAFLNTFETQEEEQE